MSEGGRSKTILSSSWRGSEDSKEKIKRIHDGAKGRVLIEDAEIDEAKKDCKLVLYGKFFGRTPTLELEVISGAPWFLRGQALSLIQWRESFQPMKESISIMPVWIQMLGLPLQFLDQKILLQLAAVIGKPVKIDVFTLSGTREKYARVCVLLDLKKPIEQGLWVEAKGSYFFQTVAYENLLNICFNCGRIGHKEEQCSVGVRVDTDKEVNAVHVKANNGDEKLLGP
ncbi:hypothetical protein Cni_G28633 [Canna indica]|uniref:CCHC-type domain-containing protein n=1 Tax=Canna indica TaxID=4628 RepID=A0AAQ3QSI2_9LILI|nr:hypothetical protein Cni_G28633 [Canna indica]